MATNKQTTPSPIIKIRVGYEWSRDGKQTKTALADEHWQSLRERIQSSANAVVERSKSSPGPIKCVIEISRLRAQHGSMILESLRERIADSDILVMDIGTKRKTQTFNPNVLLETGMAIGMGFDQNRSLFVLSPKKDLPGDLQGILRTDYRRKASEMTFVDALGFSAALRGRLITIARTKGMLGPAKKAEVCFEEEDTEQDRSPKTAKRPGRATGKDTAASKQRTTRKASAKSGRPKTK